MNRRKRGPKRLRRTGSLISLSRSITVIGAGSWGTALAVQFARAGLSVFLWGRDSEQIARMQQQRSNQKYLPDVSFPPKLQAIAEFGEALEAADDVLVVVPSNAFRATLQAIATTGIRIGGLCWATKGFELGTGLLPHQLVAQIMPADLPTAVLSGPTFAREVGAGLPSAMTIASSNSEYAMHLAKSITTESFRGYTSKDIIGVEVGGATKNVFAIGAGISDGLGFGANTRIALLTRGLAEMTRLGLALGANKDTFMGLAGMGDLVLTCTDDQSRNRRFGLALASGTTIERALEKIGQVVEGYYAALAVHKVAERLNVDMPIVEQIHGVLYRRTDPRDAVLTLMTRPLMAETA